jgi:hypothetical protein
VFWRKTILKCFVFFPFLSPGTHVHSQLKLSSYVCRQGYGMHLITAQQQSRMQSFDDMCVGAQGFLAEQSF